MFEHGVTTRIAKTKTSFINSFDLHCIPVDDQCLFPSIYILKLKVLTLDRHDQPRDPKLKIG